MSIPTSSDEYSEDELLQVCEELGLPCDEERIARLKQAIDEIVDESDTGSEEESHYATLFGGLCLSDSATSTGGSIDSLQSFSPIRRRENNSSRLGFGGESRYHNREIPLNLPTSQENEELRRYNPTAYYLLNDAWRCLSNVYGTVSMMEDLQVKLSSTRRASSQGRSTRVQIPRLFLNDENKENKAHFSTHKRAGPSNDCRRVEEAPESNTLCGSSSIPDKENFHPDPSIRCVNRFVPGQLLYRHDPVKRFELYKEEWARKPAPGERKRLALRWKVREYMLRRDIPLFDPRKPIAQHAAHPKDWSPRPYLI